MMYRLVTVGALALATGGCDTVGAKVPPAFEGDWGADCTQPFVRFDSNGSIHVYSDRASYSLSSAKVDVDGSLDIVYTTPQGRVAEHYAAEGATLRLTKGNYGGTEATWNKRPMRRCR